MMMDTQTITDRLSKSLEHLDTHEQRQALALGLRLTADVLRLLADGMSQQADEIVTPPGGR